MMTKNKRYQFAGIDYSMSCPAITIGNSKDFKQCITFYYTSTKKYQGRFGNNVFGSSTIPYDSQEERFNNIAEWAITILKKFGVEFVCLEGYSFGSKGTVFDIGENTGLLKNKMWSNNIKFITPSPGSIKKHFTQNGSAKKQMMYDTFIGQTKYDLEKLLDAKADGNPISDIVDSYAMMCYAIEQENK